MDLSKVSIGIRTFLRDPQLFNAIAAIRRTMPEVTLIIADCGDQTEEKSHLYDELSRDGHLCFTLPWDSGFGVMSNCIASAVTTGYLLVASDDFDFNPPDVRQGIERLLWALESYPELSIASGRVNNYPYEFSLEIKDGVVTEHKTILNNFTNLYSVLHCHLTVNYSLIRREVFSSIRWDDDAKIGQGEHGAFFYDCLLKEIKVAWVANVNINEQQIENSGRYRQFRNRARSPERSCFKKRGIKKYILGDGTVDYDEIAAGN